MRGRGGIWTGKSFDFGVGRTRIRYRDDGWMQIVANMKLLGSSVVEAGIVGTNARIAHPSGLSMADIAALNEYGTDDGHVPSRAFMRTIIRSAEARQAFLRAASTVATQAISRRAIPVSRALANIGRWAVAEIKKNIASTVPPPQAAATIAKKGHDGTLRETFSLYNAINYVIRKTEEKLETGFFTSSGTSMTAGDSE